MRVSDVTELLLLAALWGGSFLFMRIAAPMLGPVWLIEMRVLLAGLALLPLLIRLNLWSEVRRRAIPLFIVGCINSALPFLFLAFASVFLPAGFTSILNATSPLFGTVVAAVWLKENLTMSRTIGFVLGFAGVTVLVGWKTFTATSSFFASVGGGAQGSTHVCDRCSLHQTAIVRCSAPCDRNNEPTECSRVSVACFTVYSAQDGSHPHHYVIGSCPRSILDGVGIHSLLSTDSKCRFNQSTDCYLSHSIVCDAMGRYRA